MSSAAVFTSDEEVARAFGAEEVFFSTTDRRGVIDSVNSTFVRLSRYDADALIGQPHNIIRHPGMPGGAFHLMWERLLSGRHMAAYVVNLASDGASYRTFSTVSPLGDGFISVRAAVMRQDLWEPVEAAYRETRARELEWREQGISRAEAARRGAADLLGRLSSLGFADYDDVIRAILPAEVEARRAAAPPQAPHTEPGEPLHQVVEAIATVHHQLDALLARYAQAATMADELADGRARLEQGLGELVSAARAAADAAAAAGGAAPALATSARGAITLAEDVATDLAPLGDVLADVRAAVLDLRSVLALSALHADMSMIFTAEARMGGAVGDPADSVRRLAAVLLGSMQEAERRMGAASEGLAAAAERVESADARLREFQRLLAGWRTIVVRAGLSQTLAPQLAPVDSRLSTGLTELSRLTSLARECRAMAVPADMESSLRSVAVLVAATEAL